MTQPNQYSQQIESDNKRIAKGIRPVILAPDVIFAYPVDKTLGGEIINNKTYYPIDASE